MVKYEKEERGIKEVWLIYTKYQWNRLHLRHHQNLYYLNPPDITSPLPPTNA